ncbi:MAG: 3,4-dihydroxy-2-butanone-4-phosphate synthase [Spirochaetes bacterium]|nr:3,4-dihydroxy-2-butanone-4-phosphate synthase [Spirochaetota bacterium]
MSGIFATIEEALAEIRGGKMIIVTDDEDRENEGDFVMAADAVTAQAVNFMITHGRGLLCQAITAQKAGELELLPMARDNTSAHTTAFTVSVDARSVTSTGISAFDRAATIKAIADPACQPGDLLRPGHIFPLVAKDGGVLVRQGHTEASVDLPRLAGFAPSGILCEILNPDGSMARLPQLEVLAREHGLKIVTVEALARWRREHDSVKRVAESGLPTENGDFTLIAYENLAKPEQPHLAMVSAAGFDPENALVRVHSECLTGEALLSARCDCRWQLSEALRRAGEEGGVVVYLRQEGRGIGLAEKIRAYRLQDAGCDTLEANVKLGHAADGRDYKIAAAILRDLGIRGLRLMTNNPDKEAALKAEGFRIVERVKIEMRPGKSNMDYLKAKKARFGHFLEYV